MDKQDIIRMAREAGIKNDCDGIWCDADGLIAFAALVAAAEREACAQLCERMAKRTDDIRSAALEMAAENIRARGKE